MGKVTRGEQRFAAITYSKLALWTGLRLSTVQSYGAKGRIPKDDMAKVLQWVARYCREQGRPGPWQRVLSQRDQFSRELGFWCYKDYLRSDLWQDIRARLLPAPCRRCGAEADCVHHHQYTRENMSGKDTRQLVPLCTPCHLRIHPHCQEDAYRYEYDAHKPAVPPSHLPQLNRGPDGKLHLRP